MPKRGLDLFGQIAIQKSFINQEQLDDALRLQEEKFPTVPIGLLLVKLGHLTLSEAQAISGFQDHVLNERSRYVRLNRREFRFGGLLIEYGFATKDQVHECVRIQAQEWARGVQLRLGEIMVKKGYLTADDVRTVLTLQDKKILACRACKTQTNVAGYSPGAKVTCTKCGESLIVPPKEAWIHAEETVFLPGAAPEAVKTPTACVEPAPARGVPFGKFDLLRELGSSRGARVYQAMERESRRVVALKVYDPTAADPKEVEAALNGARAVKAVDHPGVARVLEVGEHEGRPYIAMEQVEGRTLEAWLRDRRPLENVLRLIRNVAEALDAAHRAGVVHCDVKPGNILIDEAGRPRLTDFGLARRVEAEVQQGIFGTPSYMSPEQASGEPGKLTPASDIWSLGVVLYQAATGKLPFDATDPAEVLRKVRNEEPVPPSSVDARVSEALERVILRAIEKAPASRYSSAAELAADLARLSTGHQVKARSREGFTRRMVRASKARPALAIAVAMSMIAAIALVFALLLKYR